MKSFSQFLNESYLREEEAVQGRLLNRKNQAYKDINNPNTGNRGYATDPTPTPASRRLPAGAPEAPKASPGQLNIPEPKTTTVASPTTTPSSGPTGTPPTGPVRSSIGNVSGPASNPTRPTGTPPTGPVRSSIGNVSGPASNPKPPKPPKGVKPPTSPTPTSPTVGKPPKTPEAPKVPGKFAKVGKLIGPASAALDSVLSTADERSKGSGWVRSLAKGATVAAGGLLGGTAGAIGGGGLLSAATGTAGALAGGAAAEKAFDTVAGANAVQRKAMATANRQRQAGTAVKGIGGKTTFDTKKNTITTGSGAQRKTVGLAKTGVVQRGGQSVAGNLAYKGGKAVYKAGPSAQSLAQTSSNPLERIGRSLFAGAYKKSDAANAAKKLATARASDAARNKALGVKSKPAG